MRHVMLTRYLLASVCFAAADDARAAAQKAKEDQAAKEKAEAEKAKAADAAKGGAGAVPGGEKPPADAVKDGQAPPVDPESLDVKALLTRLDAVERMNATLTAQMAGMTGPAVNEAKDVTAVSPGAAFDPRATRPLPAGVSSAPAMQPIPAGLGDGGIALGATDARAVWGNDAKGNPIEPRRYGGLEEEDVMVVATGYYDDAVRNPGDVLRGYTGPMGSWFVPVSLVKEAGGLEQARAAWAKIMAGAGRKAA